MLQVAVASPLCLDSSAVMLGSGLDRPEEVRLERKLSAPSIFRGRITIVHTWTIELSQAKQHRPIRALHVEAAMPNVTRMGLICEGCTRPSARTVGMEDQRAIVLLVVPRMQLRPSQHLRLECVCNRRFAVVCEFCCLCQCLYLLLNGFGAPHGALPVKAQFPSSIRRASTVSYTK